MTDRMANLRSQMATISSAIAGGVVTGGFAAVGTSVTGANRAITDMLAFFRLLGDTMDRYLRPVQVTHVNLQQTMTQVQNQVTTATKTYTTEIVDKLIPSLNAATTAANKLLTALKELAKEKLPSLSQPVKLVMANTLKDILPTPTTVTIPAILPLIRPEVAAALAVEAA